MELGPQSEHTLKSVPLEHIYGNENMYLICLVYLKLKFDFKIMLQLK